MNFESDVTRRRRKVADTPYEHRVVGTIPDELQPHPDIGAEAGESNESFNDLNVARTRHMSGVEDAGKVRKADFGTPAVELI